MSYWQYYLEKQNKTKTTYTKSINQSINKQNSQANPPKISQIQQMAEFDDSKGLFQHKWFNGSKKASYSQGIIYEWLH